MTTSMGINRLAKSISGLDNNDPRAGLNHLRELAREADAEDKAGFMTASAGIFFISLCISGILYSASLKVLPTGFQRFLDGRKKELEERYRRGVTQVDPEKAAKDFLDTILDLLTYVPLGAGAVGGGILYLKRKNKAARQRVMEEAMEEEMNRLKESLEQESKGETSAAGVTNNKPSLLSGINIVELFNCFADIMSIQKNLPREQEETALEYFKKVSLAVNFPESESLKAVKYFDDELYGKKESTKEDRAAFIQLLLKILNNIDTKKLKK